ncbi:MAG: UDP-N-acetylmuramoyl-L-alanyl-D-glutamate--2,6-diaminopimelate ligase [Gammaproteobacteria bacterium RIFCSPHIGHO2_12_FULL_41_15]|nr:MAG: UDP-N-acetylmuramoyl-L-alanyl-D-glutamate--2,6-diaminopimelate ligase [Gammaproteobacteria bacterium RIFCSPHIGHO2_12_FULL_41_15]
MNLILKKIKDCKDLQLDSRLVQPGDCFIAVPGQSTDGRQYIAQALKNQAHYVLYDSDHYQLPSALISETVIAVPNLTHQLGDLASAFYQHPSKQMKVIGVTGTNGKTSVTHYLAQAFGLLKISCGVIGTLGFGLVNGEWQKGTHTTPNVIDLHKQLAALRKLGAEYAAIEVSSHALDQNRVAGVHFYTVVFTNLSRDHLDYHGTMENYAAAKRQLFAVPGIQYAVINSDEVLGRTLMADFSHQYDICSFSLQKRLMPNAITCSAITPVKQGFEVVVQTPRGEANFHTDLMGEFNIANLLVVLAVLLNENYSLLNIVKVLSNITAVPGRMRCLSAEQKASVVIDFAHTPDALEKVLLALRNQCRGQLFCVFGCGGDRDRGKRPLMAGAASAYADQIIITSDNPRTEKPEQIINDIVQGLSKSAHYYIELDRERAIAYAMAQATVDDLILVAGKGHETEQIIGTERLAFSDEAIVKKYL